MRKHHVSCYTVFKQHCLYFRMFPVLPIRVLQILNSTILPPSAVCQLHIAIFTAYNNSVHDKIWSQVCSVLGNVPLLLYIECTILEQLNELTEGFKYTQNTSSYFFLHLNILFWETLGVIALKNVCFSTLKCTLIAPHCTEIWTTHKVQYRAKFIFLTLRILNVLQTYWSAPL